MFTGIVEELGQIRSVTRGAKSAKLVVGAQVVLADCHVGDSIAVNGVCLTVTSFDGRSFTADVMHETLDRSSLGALKPGSVVNLERAMAANGRFGGHIVSGHVDSLGTVASITKDDNAIWYRIATDADTLRHIVLKGSITIDGISLTVARLDDKAFEVSIIPHTQAQTNLSTKRVGDTVNLETDVIGKYVERLLGLTSPGSPEPKGEGVSKADSSAKGLSLDYLMECGF